MIRLVHAELLKLRSTQVWFWLLLAAVAVTVLFVVGQLAPSDHIVTADNVAQVFTAGGTAYVVAFVLGVLGVTTEFRYKTITTSVLITPSRWTLVTAKLIAYAIVGVLYALVCVILECAVALPWIAGKGVDYSFVDNHVLRALVTVFGVVAVFGIIGLGFGALVRNQIVAVTVGVIWLIILNGLLGVIPVIKNAYPYTPAGAVNSLFSIGDTRMVNGVELFPAWGSTIVLLLWAFVPAYLGASLSMNRDIT